MKDLIIIGAGGLGREVLGIATHVQEEIPQTEWRIKGFITDIPGDFYEKDTGGYDIIGTIKDHEISENNVYVFAIADIDFKKKTTQDFLRRGANFINLIHPQAMVSRFAHYGVGNIIQTHCGISSNVEIGNFNMFNSFTTVGHDAKIGDYCTISSHCDITGYTELGDGVFLGSHSVICPHAKVGEHARIGAGSVVLKRVKANTLVVGNPAKKISF